MLNVKTARLRAECVIIPARSYYVGVRKIALKCRVDVGAEVSPAMPSFDHNGENQYYEQQDPDDLGDMLLGNGAAHAHIFHH